MEDYEIGRHADPLNESSRLTEMMTNLAISRIRKEPGESSLECEDCGFEIPETRRKILESIGGTKQCVGCASAFEDKRR